MIAYKIEVYPELGLTELVYGPQVKDIIEVDHVESDSILDGKRLLLEGTDKESLRTQLNDRVKVAQIELEEQFKGKKLPF